MILAKVMRKKTDSNIKNLSLYMYIENVIGIIMNCDSFVISWCYNGRNFSRKFYISDYLLVLSYN